MYLRVLASIRTKLGLVLASGTIAMGAAVGIHGHQQAASTTDQQAITQLVHDSQLAEQQLCLPPGLYRTRLQVVPPGVVQQVQDNVQRTETKYYTGALLTRMVSLLQTNCAGSMTGGESIQIDGGVDSITCSSITAVGDTGTASCQVVEWLKSFVHNGNGNTDVVDPKGPVNVDDTVVRTPEGWRITAESASYPPGTGP